MSKKGRGRPKKRTLLTIDEALLAISEYYQVSEPIFSKRTIYNKISAGIISRFGPKHKVLLDKDEILEKLCK